jgi:hypothetical protein
MNRKVAIIISTVVVLASAIGTVLVIQSLFLANPQKFEVSNLTLTYGPQTLYGINLGGTQSVLRFTVRNLYSSSLTTVGITVDGVNYGMSTLQIPAGQMQEESLSVKNMVLSSSTTYAVGLTFTFADGSYQTYSGSYTTPQFKGKAQVTRSSLILSGLLQAPSFSLTLQNTGNLPITSAKYWVQNYQFESSLPIAGALMPGETVTGGWSLLITYEVGQAYSVTVQVTYIDGTTSTIQTSVIAQTQ